MKDDEKQYFIELWNLRKDRRKFLDYTFSKSNSKRFMYILDKWDKKDFGIMGLVYEVVGLLKEIYQKDI